MEYGSDDLNVDFQTPVINTRKRKRVRDEELNKKARKIRKLRQGAAKLNDIKETTDYLIHLLRGESWIKSEDIGGILKESIIQKKDDKIDETKLELMIPGKEIDETKLNLETISDFLFKANKKVNEYVKDNQCIICHELMDESIKFPLICQCKVNVCTSCGKRLEECPTCKNEMTF